MWYKYSKEFISYHDARTWASGQKIKSKEEFFLTPRPENIPSHPDRSYPEWVSWKDFLNKFATYPDAQKWAVKNNIKTQEQWYKTKKPFIIPDDPSKIYISQWKNWDSFFKTTQKVINATYEEAKQYARSKNIRSIDNWNEDISRPDNIPKFPDVIYKNKGWINWEDFLGKNYSNRYYQHRSIFDNYEKKTFNINLGKEWNKQNGITSYEQWSSTPKPEYVPNHHTQYGTQWKGWEDFLGLEAPTKNHFVIYELAKQWANTNNIKTKEQWDNTLKPQEIPYNPEAKYKKTGWINWDVFLNNQAIVNNNVVNTKLKPKYPEFISWMKENKITSLQQYQATKPLNFPKDPNFFPQFPGWQHLINTIKAFNLSKYKLSHTKNNK